jgi:hypothetical protein
MISRGKEMKQQARSKRLSAALRENLKRRKAQARGRAAGPSGEETAQARVWQSPDFRRNRGSD